MSDCLFCAIVAGEIPATLVHQDEHTVAFADVNPQAPTHVLVVPRVHVASIAELGPAHAAVWQHLLDTVQTVAREADLIEDGFRVVANTGPNAGQSVPHLHLHVLGGRALAWPPG